MQNSEIRSGLNDDYFRYISFMEPAMWRIWFQKLLDSLVKIDKRRGEMSEPGTFTE